MRRPEDDAFELRPRPPRNRSGEPGKRFVSRVIAALNKASAGTRDPRASRHPGPRGSRWRGHVAAAFAGGQLGRRSRRVIIKMRLVGLKAVSPRSARTHLRYLVREGVTRDGEPGRAYDAVRDDADLQTFEERAAGDRHQFRFIIAPEDAVAIEDLRSYTRELMVRVERDLGTRLDWVAVDHWDTDNPHTHLVLRGKDQNGRGLIIARDYIRHGMRQRACELATEWLGPRTDQELREARHREVEQERWTSLDRELKARAHNGVISLSGPFESHLDQPQRAQLRGRLARLQTMGLAEPVEGSTWRLRADAEAVLRAMGERGDIVRTLQRALGKEVREAVIFDPAKTASPVIGRIAAKGLADGLKKVGFVVIDSLDGRAHYVRLHASADLADLPIGGIAEVHPTGDRRADRNIVRASVEGIYRTDIHRAQLSVLPSQRDEADAVVASHVRRLEALRREGHAERLAEGLWRIPDDLIARGQAYDRRHLGVTQVNVLSHWSIDQQTRALGATWLDGQLLDRTEEGWAAGGFAAEVRNALQARAHFLVGHGWAEQRDGRLIVQRDLIPMLRARDLEAAGRLMARETGLAYLPLSGHGPVSGTYRRSIVLASGRFAMLDDGLGFSLVPWQPVIERRLGHYLSAVIRDDRISWHFGRQLSR
jgi:type IV secretory pathway VirD2 relaxase